VALYAAETEDYDESRQEMVKRLQNLDLEKNAKDQLEKQK